MNKRRFNLICSVLLILIIICYCLFIKTATIYHIKDIDSIAEKYMFSAERKLGVYRPVYLNFDHQDELYDARDEFCKYVIKQESPWIISQCAESVDKQNEVVKDYYNNYLVKHFGEKIYKKPGLLKEHVIAYRFDIDKDGADEIFGVIRHPNFVSDYGVNLFILKTADMCEKENIFVPGKNMSGYLNYANDIEFFNGIYIMPEPGENDCGYQFYSYGDMKQKFMKANLALRLRQNIYYSDYRADKEPIYIEYK